jgi:hypothetical protein
MDDFTPDITTQMDIALLSNALVEAAQEGDWEELERIHAILFRRYCPDVTASDLEFDND